jgi:uncharacterized protein YegL
MKKDYTHISMILDKSGSMQPLIKDTIGGFNSFLNDQKKLNGTATMTVVQFDNQYEVHHSFKDIKEISELNESTYIPRASTALRDAIGRTINETGKHLDSLSEENKPEKVVVVIITDGLENASKLFSASDINQMIEHQQQKYGWQFTFIGSNQDAITSAGELGIAAAAALDYSPTSQGVKMSYDILSRSVGHHRAGLTKSISYTIEDRKKAINK